MDSLLEAVRAAPDDDAPRLVWADREGGERGELVVLQCQIAAKAGTRAARVRMQARVRELLPRFQGTGETMVRGFIEATVVGLDACHPALFERLPLLRCIELVDFPPDIDAPLFGSKRRVMAAWREGATRFAETFARLPPDRIRVLRATAELRELRDLFASGHEHPVGDAFIELVATTPALAGVRELRIIGGDLTGAAIPHLARLRELTTLRGGMRLGGAQGVELLRHVPWLKDFGPWGSRLTGDELATLLAAPETRRLRRLDLWANGLGEHDLVAIAETPFIGLESLGIGHSPATPRALDAIVEAPHLASLVALDLHRPRAERLRAPPFQLPHRLRSLRLGPGPIDDAAIAAIVAVPTLDELSVAGSSFAEVERLRETIPLVNDGDW